MVGPLPKSSMGHMYILAATEYFSKWVKAAPYKKVKKPELLSYVNYVKKLLEWFDQVILEHMPRQKNRQADSITSLASSLVLPSAEVKVPLCKRWVLPSITISKIEDIKSDVVLVYEIKKED